MMLNKPLVYLTHVGTAYFQAVLSILFVTCYFWLLIAFMRGEVHVPPEFKDTFQTLLGFLTATLGVVVNFWFSRDRTSADPKQNPADGQVIATETTTATSVTPPVTASAS